MLSHLSPALARATLADRYADARRLHAGYAALSARRRARRARLLHALARLVPRRRTVTAPAPRPTPAPAARRCAA